MTKYSEIMEAKKGINEVNDKLKEGWDLIQCVALPHAVLYIMGKPKELEGNLFKKGK
jgi:hypothetical protein